MRSNARSSASTGSSQVQGVNATAGGLVKATLGAAVVAGAILTLVWLPAEYGIDPTGAGHVLGLTEMGHIKEQLHAEADADAAAARLADAVQPASDVAVINQKLDAMQKQLLAISATLAATSEAPNVQGTAQADAQGTADAQALRKPIHKSLHKLMCKPIHKLMYKPSHNPICKPLHKPITHRQQALKLTTQRYLAQPGLTSLNIP